jgi:hypothetical protein
MKKHFFVVAVLILATSWALAQGGYSQQPDQSQTEKGKSIVGCLSGAADTFVLTDAKGHTYELTGDTSMLKDNVGHKVRLYGNVGNSGGGPSISTQGPQRTFGVQKLESLSDTCK